MRNDTVPTPNPLHFENTPKLEAAHIPHVIARAQLEAGASAAIIRNVIRGGDFTMSATRRRVAAWLVGQGYWRHVKAKPEAPKKSFDELMAAAERALGGGS